MYLVTKLSVVFLATLLFLACGTRQCAGSSFSRSANACGVITISDDKGHSVEHAQLMKAKSGVVDCGPGFSPWLSGRDRDVLALCLPEGNPVNRFTEGFVYVRTQFEKTTAMRGARTWWFGRKEIGKSARILNPDTSTRCVQIDATIELEENADVASYIGIYGRRRVRVYGKTSINL